MNSSAESSVGRQARGSWLGGDRPRVLVGILHAGEQEYRACVSSVLAQRYPNLEHVVFADLSNREAHQRLYAEFMARSGEFDLFVKLDADMVFRHEDAVSAIAHVFQARRALDQALFAVHDHFSNSLIMGLHVFSSRCVWTDNGDPLFVDPHPRYPGQQAFFWNAPVPLVEHAPNPSPLQAFRFGLHRASKAIQQGRPFHYWRAAGQWSLLQRVWREFRDNRRLASGFAILGADLLFQGKVWSDAYQHGPVYWESLFGQHAGKSWVELARELEPRWGSRIRRGLWYRRRTGLARYYVGGLDWIGRRLYHAMARRLRGDGKGRGREP